MKLSYVSVIYSFLYLFFLAQIWIQWIRPGETISDRERYLPSVPWADSETDFYILLLFTQLGATAKLRSAAKPAERRAKGGTALDANWSKTGSKPLIELSL